MRRFLAGQLSPAQALQLSGLLAAALALRLYGVWAEPLWYDEQITVGFLPYSLSEFLHHVRYGSPGIPPLYFLLEYGWAHQVHDSVLSLRLLSVAFGFGTVVLLYLLGRMLADHGVAVTATALMALNSFHIFQSQEIRMYAMGTFLCVLSYVLYVASLRGARWPWLAVVGVVNGLLFWTHPFTLFAVAPQMLAVLWRGWRDWRAWLWVAVQAVAYLAAVWWVMSAPERDRILPAMDWLAPPGLLRHWKYPSIHTLLALWGGFRLTKADLPLAQFLLNQENAVMGFYALLFAAVACASLLRRQGVTVEGERLGLLWAWMGLPVLCLFVLSYLFSPVFIYRYMLFGFPAFCLLVAMGMSRITWATARRMLIVLLLALMLFQYFKAFGVPFRPDFTNVC